MKIRFLLIPLAIAGALFAQNAQRPDPVQRRVQMLTRFLSLTADQQSQVTTILTNEQTSLQVNAPTLQTNRQALLDAIKANDAGQIDVLTSQNASLEAQQNAIRAKAAASIYALLTSDQQSKLGKGLGMLFGGGFGMGRMGPPRGRGPR
jgi:Spy/CpxP family protein refolding chaperone